MWWQIVPFPKHPSVSSNLDKQCKPRVGLVVTLSSPVQTLEMNASETPTTLLEADDDDDDDDNDSALGIDLSSETQSLSSRVMKFEFENGRRYHAFQAGMYAFPNDEEELNRMDLENHLFLMLLGGKLHHAPLKSPQRILDLGTGTGIWAVEIADQYPSAAVVGTDLSPVQPTMVPPNLKFEIDDFEQEWTFQKDSFDFIHWRLLLASVSDYPRLFRQAFQHTKPGGYMEIHDIDPGQYCDDGTVTEDSSSVLWSQLFYEGCEKAGRPIPLIDSYKVMMENAGFVDIKEQILKRPSNTWPKDKNLKRIGLVSYLANLNPW
jgi:ubiquinone/menaquinone biosynthesis C-methylase UbiE